MLASFSVQNHLSFREPVRLEMRGPAGNPGRRAVVFGSGASGRSSLVDALDHMRRLVICGFSAEASRQPAITAHPFIFGDESDTESRFEVELLIHGRALEYGFAIEEGCVIEERLRDLDGAGEGLVFERRRTACETGRGMVCGEGHGDLMSCSDLGPHVLFAPAAAAMGHGPASLVVEWFVSMRVLRSHPSSMLRMIWRSLALMRDDPQVKERVLDFMRRLGFDALDLRIGTMHFPGGSEGRGLVSDKDIMDAAMVYRLHGPGDGMGEVDIYNESDGVKTALALAGIMFGEGSAGGLAVVDDLDARLHPLAVREVLRAWRDGDDGLPGQMVGMVRESSLLEGGLLEPHEIWVALRRPDRSTSLARLCDMAGDGDIDARRLYLSGFFDALRTAGGQG